MQSINWVISQNCCKKLKQETQEIKRLHDFLAVRTKKFMIYVSRLRRLSQISQQISQQNFLNKFNRNNHTQWVTNIFVEGYIGGFLQLPL